jgi:hypothetical protein
MGSWTSVQPCPLGFIGGPRANAWQSQTRHMGWTGHSLL